MAKRIALGKLWTGPNGGAERLSADLFMLDKALTTPLKKAKSSPRYMPPVVVPRTDYMSSLEDIREWGSKGWDDLEIVFRAMAKDLSQGLKTKLRQWATETLADMKAVTPVYTGNLKQSLGYLNNTNGAQIYNQVKTISKTGQLTISVGIREKALLPPPYYKPVKDNPKKKIKMPDYNYAPFANDFYLDDFEDGFIGEWIRIAEENAERIFK